MEKECEQQKIPDKLVEVRFRIPASKRDALLVIAGEGSLQNLCAPVIVALANGDIVSKVVDLRKK